MIWMSCKTPYVKWILQIHHPPTMLFGFLFIFFTHTRTHTNKQPLKQYKSPEKHFVKLILLFCCLNSIDISALCIYNDKYKYRIMWMGSRQSGSMYYYTRIYNSFNLTFDEEIDRRRGGAKETGRRRITAYNNRMQHLHVCRHTNKRICPNLTFENEGIYV